MEGRKNEGQVGAGAARTDLMEGIVGGEMVGGR